MDLKLILNFVFISFANTAVVDYSNSTVIPDNVFNGVYSECFLHLSYSCLQTKTLLYLKELNNLSEVSVIGDYVKFVKINMSDIEEGVEDTKSGDTEELAFMIDEAIDNFFDNHVLKFYALGRNLSMPRNVEEFVGRKKRKGGGGGMMGGHGGGGHDDGGKKKMMMMAMMCMKMKLMMMVPAMMGMMGMMSFKGMMFSMMSFMISKMMLLMKILEKKGGGIGGGGGGGGLDGGWAAGGTGGGAWMPAGGQDYAGGGGGGGGGYDANGQWQSRSIIETPETYKTIQVTDIRQVNKEADGRMPTNNEKWYIKTDEIKPVVRNSDKWQSDKSMLVKAKNVGQWRSRSIDENPFEAIENKPTITFVKPVVRYNNKIETESYKNPVLFYKKSNVNFDFDKQDNDNGSGDRDIDVNQRTKRDTGYENKEQIIKVVQGQVQNKIFNGDQHVNADIANKLVGNKLNFKSRQKRSLIDMLQNSYIYWVNKILGLNNNRRTNLQRYKIINGIKYVYTPYRVQKQKMPKEIQINSIKNAEDIRTMVAVEDFNKGEIVEGGIESRMNKKKFNKMKDSVNDTMDDNPWE